MLHAALDEPRAAAAAWKSWRAAAELDDVDHGSTRLLPLVYRNLGPDAFDAEVAGRLKGLYRHAWGQNQLLFRRAAEAIRALEAAGIETLVTKGVSLALLAYGDVGARPMDDADVLVPLDRTREAIEVLVAAGWRAGHDDPLAWTQVHHSLGFAGPAGGDVDLHWFSLWQPARDDELWRASVPMEVGGVTTRAPCPADQLLLACVHGTPWSPLPPFRWIADAVVTVRAAGEGLDWDRVGEEAERRELTVATGAALAYLRDEFDLTVPRRLSDHLAAAPASRHERAAFGPPAVRTARCARCAWPGIATGACVASMPGRRRPPASSPSHERFWGLESAWQLPLHAAGALSRRRERDAARSAP